MPKKKEYHGFTAKELAIALLRLPDDFLDVDVCIQGQQIALITTRYGGKPEVRLAPTQRNRV